MLDSTPSTGGLHAAPLPPLGWFAFFGVPTLVLAASYLWLVLDHRSVLLWDVVVHEDGRHTLGETVLYFGHFLREVPVAIAYVLFLLGVSHGVSHGVPDSHRRSVRSSATLYLSGATGLVVGALAVTAHSDGLGSALRDLLQYRMRDGLEGYGTHWGYHWLATVWFGAAVGLAPAVTRRLPGFPVLLVSRSWARAAWYYVLALTIIFGLSGDVFLDVRHAGHQAREIMTHGPVTALLGVGILMVAGAGVARWELQAPQGLRRSEWVRLALAVVIPVYLAMVSLRGDVMAEGQSEYGLSAMVAAHYYEHTLDYGFVALLLLGGLSLASRSGARAYRRRKGSSHPVGAP
jgi:hypothetical protein